MKNKAYLILSILLLTSLGQVAAHLYLPSIPAIGKYFHNQFSLAQLSISLYLVGYASSQLVYGVVSDALGRRHPLLVGISLLIVGCILAASAPSLPWLIVGRLIQGIGAGSSYTSAKAILRDYYINKALAVYNSYISAASVILMAIAPVIGGYLQQGFGWRANFIFLSGYSLMILLLLITKVPESNLNPDLTHLNWKQSLHNLKTLITEPAFSGTIAITFFTYAGVYSFLTTAPIILEMHVGLHPADMGWIILSCGICYFFGANVNAQLVRRLGLYRMIFLGVLIFLLCGISLFILRLFYPPKALTPLLTPVLIMMFATGFIFPNTFAVSTSPFGKIAGLATSIYGFMQFIGGAIASAIFSALNDGKRFTLAIFLILFAALCFIIILLLRKPCQRLLQT